MKVEERCLGVSLTPEGKDLVREVFERALGRVEGRVDHVRLRLVPARRGIQCRARLWPNAGPTLVVSMTRASTMEAVLATAGGLVRKLQGPHVAHGRRREPAARPAS
jgi:hypothetical protein